MEWDPALADVVEALVAGRNGQTVYRRFRRVVAVETETWDESGERRRSTRRFRMRAGLLRPFALRS